MKKIFLLFTFLTAFIAVPFAQSVTVNYDQTKDGWTKTTVELEDGKITTTVETDVFALDLVLSERQKLEEVTTRAEQYKALADTAAAEAKDREEKLKKLPPLVEIDFGDYQVLGFVEDDTFYSSGNEKYELVLKSKDGYLVIDSVAKYSLTIGSDDKYCSKETQPNELPICVYYK